MEHVRRAALVLGSPHERVTLLHAEPVLLVHHEQREAREAHVGLQERVRPDRQPRLSGRDARERLPALPCSE